MLRTFVSRFWKSPKVVRVMLAQHFLEGFMPIAALYAIMFERVGGLDFQQIGLVFAAWGFVYVLFEVPSGVLADYWSRKYVIMLGGIMRAVGLVVWLIWPTFTGYAIGFALWGVMIACTSGAADAFLHTELRARGKGKQFAKYFGWMMSTYWLGMLLGYIVASIFTLQHFQLLIGLGAVSSLLYVIVLALVPEHPYKKQDTYLKTLVAGTREILVSKTLQYVCFGLFSIYVIIGVIEELLPRIYAGFGLSERVIALLLAASLVLTVGVLTRLESFVRFSLAKQVLCMVLGLVCFLAGLRVGGGVGSAFVLTFSLVFHLFRPIFQHHVQAAATGEERATIGSIPGLGGGFFGALAYVAIGKGSERSGELGSMAVYGAVWLVLLLVFAYMGRAYELAPAQDGVVEPSQPSTQF